MKSAEQRKQTLLRMLRESRKLTIEQAVSALGVSESTVRRLFTQLEADGCAIRTYGGICQNEAAADSADYSFEITKLRNPAEKMRIGKAAEALITPSDVIFLDSGSTVMSLCAVIDRIFTEDASGESALKREKYGSVTVFTNSLVNFELLKKHMRVCLVGGEYRDKRRDFCGYLAENALADLHFTKCFIGADGYGEKNGVLASDFGTARINQLVAGNSAYRVLLADSTKFGKNSLVRYSPFSVVDCLVTDGALPKEAAARFIESGVKVITA